MSTNAALNKMVTGEGLVVDHAKVPHFEMAGNHMYGLATPARGARQVEVWFTTIDVGAETPVHGHSAEEVVVVLKGRGEARRIGRETVTFEAPCTLILPAHELHQLANTGRVALEAFASLPVGSKVFDERGVEMALPWRE